MRLAADVAAMAEEIKSPKQHGVLFLGCFGCGSRKTFKNKASSEGKKVARGRGRGPRTGLYWSISKSAASTVPVEAAAAVIVAAAKTTVESDKSGLIQRYGQQRLEQAVSLAAVDGPPAEATQEKRTVDGQKPSRTESDRKKRVPPPIPIAVPAVVRRNVDSDNRLDPIVGMSIVMVTLMVLVSWGQLCAILCTAAWFYVLPRLRQKSDKVIGNKVVVESLGQGVEYLSSVEYKKKVVLEGLLQRNRRDSSLVT